MPNRYWVGGAGTWDASSTTHWSASSGGASGASVPTSSDSVFFDQAGTYTVTLGTSANLTCLDWTVSAGTVTFAGTPSNISLYGSIDLKSGTVCSFTLSYSNFVLYGVNKTIQTNGTALTNTGFNMRGAGTYTLLGAVTCTTIAIFPASGTTTLALGGYTLTLTQNGSGALSFYNNSAINFGTGGNITLSAASGGVYVSSPSNTITTSGTGTIQLNGSSASFSGQGKTFTGVTLSKGGTGTLTISGSNTFDNIQNTAQPVFFSFTAGTVTTVTNFNVNGTSGNLVTLQSATAGTQFSISKASGTITANYLSIKDSAATGGATWNANYSTDAGNNSGWTITSGAGSVTVTLTNTNLAATGYVGNITLVGDQTVTLTNTGLLTTGYLGTGYTIFTGTGVVAGVTSVSATGGVGNVTPVIVQNASVTLTGLYATGIISNTPLNIWISVDTNQTTTWVPIAT